MLRYIKRKIRRYKTIQLLKKGDSICVTHKVSDSSMDSCKVLMHSTIVEKSVEFGMVLTAVISIGTESDDFLNHLFTLRIILEKK